MLHKVWLTHEKRWANQIHLSDNYAIRPDSLVFVIFKSITLCNCHIATRLAGHENNCYVIIEKAVFRLYPHVSRTSAPFFDPSLISVISKNLRIHPSLTSLWESFIGGHSPSPSANNFKSLSVVTENHLRKLQKSFFNHDWIDTL